MGVDGSGKLTVVETPAFNFTAFSTDEEGAIMSLEYGCRVLLVIKAL